MPPFVTIISDVKPFVNIFFTRLPIIFYFIFLQSYLFCKKTSGSFTIRRLLNVIYYILGVTLNIHIKQITHELLNLLIL